MEQEDTVFIDFSDSHIPTKEELKAMIKPRGEIAKPIVEYDLEGNVLNTYDNCNAAGKALGIKGDTIRKCCTGQNLICESRQCIFLYRGDDILKRLELIDKREDKKWKRGLPKRVIEYNLRGRFLFQYPSAKMAAKVNKVSTAAITACCRGGKLYIDKRIFLYPEDDIKQRLPLVKEKLFLESQRRKKCSPVDEYTLDGKFVKAYISASEAARTTGCCVSRILDCCRGIEHTSKYNFLQTKGRIFLFPGSSISERLEHIKVNQNK